MKAWLLEVNTNPALHLSNPVLKKVIPTLESRENDFAVANLIRVGRAYPFVDKVGYLQFAGAGGVACSRKNDV